MSKSFIKKIINPEELKQVLKDLKDLFKNEDNVHAFNLEHNLDLITKSLSHESLLLWNIHVWSHFNGEQWDGIFIGIIRKSEKFNKKIMDEYLWLSKKSNSGVSLFNTALKYAKNSNCEFVSMNVTEKHPLSSKVKNFYKKNGFEKDSETYIKKI